MTGVLTAELLTAPEQDLVDRLGSCYSSFATIVGDGPTRDADLTEFVAFIHGAQAYVLSQAAARAYPERYRLLGESWQARSRSLVKVGSVPAGTRTTESAPMADDKASSPPPAAPPPIERSVRESGEAKHSAFLSEPARPMAADTPQGNPVAMARPETPPPSPPPPSSND